MQRLAHPHDIRAITMQWHSEKHTIAFVPTMGALHEGHRSLIDEARARADKVIVSIFVNPLQFNEQRDLDSYPNTLDQDFEVCLSAGVDLVWTPSREDMYPDNHGTMVVAGIQGEQLEGAHRPGHFDGMLTIVLKLLNAVKPTWALFGEKDFQQLALVKQLVKDYYLDTDIVPMPIIRESDGLAMSSRNIKLSQQTRRRAIALYEALMTVQDAAQAGYADFSNVIQSMHQRLNALEGFTLEYAVLVDPESLVEQMVLERQLRFLIAGSFENEGQPVRLIDNGPVIRLSDKTIPLQYS